MYVVMKVRINRLVVALALLSVGGNAAAQYIPLVDNKLYFDFDRLWGYNLYEHSRWGGGLKYTPNKSIDLTGYVGYGVRDQQWKGGLGFAARLPWSKRQGTVYLNGGRDYFAAASRQMQAVSLTDFSGLSAFMSRRMSDRLFAQAGYRWRSSAWSYGVEGTVFAGGRLFNDYSLLYKVDGDGVAAEDGGEVRFTVGHRCGVSAELLGAYTTPPDRMTQRLLVQYDKSHPVGPFDLHTFLQTGITTPDAPYIYMFDLGGTYGAPVHFRNALLTAEPNEFTANYFAFTSLRFMLRKPLYKIYSRTFAVGSNPRPLVGMNAAWGDVWGPEVSSAVMAPMGYVDVDGMTLMPPNHGVVEALVGIDGLIKWGIVDYGTTVAWRAPLQSADESRWVLLLSANITI